MKKAKILFIANEIQSGGATKSLFYLVSNIKNQYDPIILVNKEGYLTQMCDKNNIKYLKVNYKPFATGRGSTKLKKIMKKVLFPALKIRYILCNKIALYKIDKKINMKEIALIHTNINRDDFGAMLSQKYHIPHIMHLREFGDIDFNCFYFKKNYIEYLNQHTNYFIAISNVIKSHFINRGLDESKMKMIYNGVKQNPKAKLKNTDKLNILFLGAIRKNKGQLEIIEALNLVPQNIREKITLDFYGGSDASYKALLLEKIRKYNLQNVRLNDYLNDVEQIMDKYNVGIMCSKSEAFGRVIVEYMTNKLITIVPNQGACKEIVTDNSGFIYEYGNYQSLADILIKIYNMSIEEKNQMENNAHERAKDFSDENNAKNIMKLYEEVLQE